MQGFERVDRQFLDAAVLAGYLVPEESMFALLAAPFGGRARAVDRGCIV